MRKSGNPDEWKIQPLAEAALPVYSADPAAKISLCSPSIEIMPGGRVIAAFSQTGPGLRDLPGKKARHPRTGHWMQGRILVSNDFGKTWQDTHLFPFCGGRLFRDGHILYLIGESGNLQIIKSADGGLTWSDPSSLTAHSDAEGDFAEPPANIFVDERHIAMVWMRHTSPGVKGTAPQAAVFMRAARGANLMSPRQWTFGESPAGQERFAGHDAHVVRVTEPHHSLNSTETGTCHIILRPAQGHQESVMALKVSAQEDGSLKMEAGAALPLPGCHSRFQILFDPDTKLYWLISAQARTSFKTRRTEEPLLLQLHFSSGLSDWVFAGLLQTAETALQEVCGAIHGSTLYLAGTSGGKGPHRSSVGLAAVKYFRELVYP